MSHVDMPCWEGELDWSCCDTDPGLLPSGQRLALEEQAVYFLWAATGRRFGLCPRTYRPCRKECNSYWGGGWQPWKTSGDDWVNLSCGKCPGTCGCDTVSEVVIPHTQAVSAVEIDGIPWEPCGLVVVYDHRRIVRVDGGEWPTCQNLSAIDGPGTWSITVLQGTPWPPGFLSIAGLLACEMSKACLGLDGCQLPKRIQTITRQGVTVGFQDSFDGLAMLRTGIWELDAWIEAARFRNKGSARIVSPDVSRPAELTWWPLEGDC